MEVLTLYRLYADSFAPLNYDLLIGFVFAMLSCRIYLQRTIIRNI